MIFVDASAMVAILTAEPKAAALAQSLQAASQPVTSAIAIYETTLAVRRKREGSVAETEADVMDFVQAAGIRVVPIGVSEVAAALDAFSRYGRGQGHPARLNMGDCFAYAVARTNGAALLFMGDDFAQTDAVLAIAPTRTRPTGSAT